MSFNNWIWRYWGDQHITAYNKNNNIETGYGCDQIVLTGGCYNYVNARGGHNTVTSDGHAHDTIYTYGGDDVINSGGGNDHISAGYGNNIVHSGSGNDCVVAGCGDDKIYAGSGHDTITAGAGNNIVEGGSGNDHITAVWGNDTINGGEGCDTIYADGGCDVVDGGAGSDRVFAGYGQDEGHYVFTENKGACDYYDGGANCHDTLVLHLTREEFNCEAVQCDLARYQRHLDCGLSGIAFCFHSTDLTAIRWENLKVVITDPIQIETKDDRATTVENAGVPVDVLLNDNITGANQSELTLSSAKITNNATGTVEIVDNKVFYQPEGYDALNVGDSVNVEIEYTLTTQSGDTATAILRVKVKGTNDAPVAEPDTITIEAGNIKPLLVLANDTDIDNPNDSLQLIGFNVTDGDAGDFALENNDIVFNAEKYTDLAYGQTKTFTYNYIIKDVNGAQAMTTGEVIVKGTNDLGQADNGKAYRTDEDTTIQMDVLKGVVALDNNQTLSVENVKVNSDAVTVSSDGKTITLDPVDFEHLSPERAGQPDTAVNSGSVEVTYDVVSTSGQRQTVTKTVIIDGVNDAPEVSSNALDPITVGSGTSQSMQYHLVGSATVANDAVVLTPALKKRQGAIWTHDKVDVSESFTLTATLNFGNKTNTAAGDLGADGIALVIQSQSNTIIGSASRGGNIGYVGLDNSLAVEMDTYQNGVYDDPAQDHVGFSVNGNGKTVETKALDFDLEDGQDHTIRYEYNSDNQTSSVYIDDNFVTSYQRDISGIVGSNSAYIGFTSATGSSSNVHSVKTMDYTGKPETESVTFDVVAKDIDRGDMLSLDAKLNDTSLGSLIAVDENTLTFTPAKALAEGEKLDVGFEYTVTDSYGGHSTASTTLQVIGTGTGGFELDVTDSSQFIV